MIYEIFYTLAKYSIDAVINPPIRKPKVLLPLCNRNNSNLCVRKGVTYH